MFIYVDWRMLMTELCNKQYFNTLEISLRQLTDTKDINAQYDDLQPVIDSSLRYQ